MKFSGNAFRVEFMVKKVSLELSDKAYKKLLQSSKQLELTVDEFATICFEYVEAKHKGIKAAADRLKQRSKPAVNKQNLDQHLQQLSDEQIELLLTKAAQKKKN